jgi:zinc protease
MIVAARRLRGLGLLILALIGATAAADPAAIAPAIRSAWGFDRGDILPDPAVRFGVLANGMRYAILRNALPAGGVAVRLRVAAGSVDERSDEHGVAHFLEHMAFLGSRHIAEGQFTPLLERSGLASGRDVNAHTYYGQTVYRLDLPRSDAALVETALMLMRETASELSLSPGAVERARPVVLDELRGADDVDARSDADLAEFFIPGAPSARSIFGTAAELARVDAATLRRFYARLYTPARATLIVVGDVDPADMEARIATHFADWRAAPGEAARTAPAIDPDRPTALRVFAEPAAPTSVTIASVMPPDSAPDSVARRNRQYLEYLASLVFNRRLEGLARAPDARFLAASSGIYDFRIAAKVAEIDVTAKDGDWRGALAAGEQELRRALRYGFRQSEVDELLRSERQTLGRSGENRSSSAIADGMVAMLDAGTIFTAPPGPADARAYVARIRADAVTAAFRAAWAQPGRLVRVSRDAPLAESEVAAAWSESGRGEIRAPRGAGRDRFAYADFGPPGRVVADGRIEDLGLRTIRFANNVRLTLRRTDFERGRVLVSLRLGGGALDFPQQPDGLANFMGTAFAAGGTRRHSLDALQSIMAGRMVRGGVDVLPDGFGGARATTPEDLLAQLQLLAAYVTAPGYRPEGEAQWRAEIAAWYPTLDDSPEGVATREVDRMLAGGDTRFGVGPEATLARLDFTALRPVIAEPFARGPIEIGIAGDVDEAQAIDAVARTFGALPPRRAEPAAPASPPPHFPEDRATRTFHHHGAPDDALAAIYWPLPPAPNARELARISVLRAVLLVAVRDRVREELGATYTPGAPLRRWLAWPDFAYLGIRCATLPGKVDEVLAAIEAIAARLAAAPPAPDLVERGRNPLLAQLAREHRDNATWVRLAAVAQSHPEELDRFRDEEAALRAVTPAELADAARRYLSPQAALRVRILPP